MRYFRKIYWAFYYSISLTLLIDFTLKSISGLNTYVLGGRVISFTFSVLFTIFLRPLVLAIIFAPIFMFIRKIFRQVKFKKISFYFFFIPIVINNLIIYGKQPFDISIFTFSLLLNCLSFYFFILLFRDMPRPLTVLSFKNWIIRTTRTSSEEIPIEV